MENIKLNFVPLADQSSEFTIYRKLVEDSSIKQDDGLYRTKLPESNKENDDWGLYDISFTQKEGFEQESCSYRLNAALSEFYLYSTFLNVIRKNDGEVNYHLPNSTKYKEVIFPIQRKTKGSMEIILHPYYLRSKKTLGFLLQNKFSLDQNCEFDRKSQIESLSLDSSGRPNIFMYRDKEALISHFAQSTLASILINTELAITPKLVELDVRELDRKSYMVGDGQISQSQFMGIKSSGPYRRIQPDIRYLFLFSERTRSLGRDVYLGLTGKLFPSQFSGLDKMFGIPIRKDLVDHYSITDFTKLYIDQLTQYLHTYKEEHSDQKIMMIVVLPKGFKGIESAFDAYGHIKLIALEKKVYCQFVTEDTFYRKDLLKWSVSNIGLQIFSKLGGIPWLVKPAKNDCLILGLGSSHEFDENNIIKKWFAYTVCLDSSGEFKYIRPLSASNEENNYLDTFKENLQKILKEELNNNYKSFVLHVPFKIKKTEVSAIQEVVNNVRGEQCEVIVIRINTIHKYLGFSEHNTRVPYESSLVQLSYNLFMLWPEGLQFGKEVLHKRVSEPLLIDFIEPPESWDSKKDCLQDILNLTGANWRGFNSKAQPISILYSKLIADFMKEFSHLDGVDDLKIVKAESVAPWFL